MRKALAFGRGGAWSLWWSTRKRKVYHIGGRRPERPQTRAGQRAAPGDFGGSAAAWRFWIPFAEAILRCQGNLRSSARNAFGRVPLSPSRAC